MIKKLIDRTEEGRDPVPGWTPEFQSRFKAVLDLYDDLQTAAAHVGYTADQLARWRDGKAKPSFFPLIALALAANVSMEWLIRGSGRMELGARSPDDAPALLEATNLHRMVDAYTEARSTLGLPYEDQAYELITLALRMYDALTSAARVTAREFGSRADQASDADREPRGPAMR
jgi:hypothetical protein